MQQNCRSFPVSCLMQSHQKLWQLQLFWRGLGNMLRGQCISGQVPFSSHGIRIGTISLSPALVSTPNHCNRNKYYFPCCWKALQQFCHNIGSKKKKKRSPTYFSLYLPKDVQSTSVWPSLSPACHLTNYSCISSKYYQINKQTTKSSQIIQNPLQSAKCNNVIKWYLLHYIKNPST